MCTCMCTRLVVATSKSTLQFIHFTLTLTTLTVQSPE